MSESRDIGRGAFLGGGGFLKTIFSPRCKFFESLIFFSVGGRGVKG